MNGGLLRILGSSGGYPIAGFPCSGYLAQVDGRRVLLDCGPGVITALIGPDAKANIDAVVISHLHPDHVLDLIPLGYALLSTWLTSEQVERLPLYLPPGGLDFLRRFSDLFGHRGWRLAQKGGTAGRRALATALEDGQDWMLTVFDVREFSPGDTIAVGGLSIETLPVDHQLPTAAMRIKTEEADLVYSADTRFLPTLAEFALGTDLFLVDAHHSGPNAPGGAHMTPSDAGRLAAMAGAKRLVLCHLGAPGDGASATSEASVHFDGQVHVAFETREYAL